MNYRSIAAHMRPYRMLSRRRTTINHAFAAAVSPSDVFDDTAVRAAIVALGQDPDAPLRCAYCPRPAETWDHVCATVRDSRFSGHGHRIGNLLPCCKDCNWKKGNREWGAFLASNVLDKEDAERRRVPIQAYIARFSVVDDPAPDSADYAELDRIRKQVLELLHEGDRVAERIRQRTTKAADQGVVAVPEDRE